MSCEFSCFLCFSDAFKENDVGTFKADNGDLYTVKYRSNVCRDLMLKMEWTNPKQILATVKLYNSTFKRCFSSKGLVVNGRKCFMKLRGAFNVSNSRNYKVLCVITLIPYITFNDYKELTSESFDSGITDPENIPNNCVSSVEISQKEIDVPSGYNRIMLDEIIPIEKSNMTISENVISDKMETEMSLLLPNKNGIISCGQSDKLVKNVYEALEIKEISISQKNMEIEKNTLESNIADESTNFLINKSNGKTNECLSSSDSPSEIKVFVECKSQDALEKGNILIVSDLSEEVKQNTAKDISNDKKIPEIIVENNATMKVVPLEFPSEKPFVLHDEENVSDNSDSTTNEVLSNKVPSKFNDKTKIKKSALLDDEDDHYADEAINTEDTDSNSLDSNDISLENNSVKEYSFPYDNFTVTKDPCASKEYNNDACSPDFKQTTPLIDNWDKSDFEKIKPRKNLADNHNSVSPTLSPSKTELVFQTLVHNLSVENNSFKIPEINEEADNNLGINITSSESHEVAKKTFPIMESELKGLSMDMLDLLTSGDMADAIITNGKKNVKVHRAIVSARSSVLKDKFTIHNEDGITYRAVVNIPSYILEDVIIFLYVGLVYIKSIKMIQDLHDVGERYCINDLIDICSKHISK